MIRHLFRFFFNFSSLKEIIDAANSAALIAPSFPIATAATGNLGPKSGDNLTFNSATGALTATSFVGSGANLTDVDAGATGGGSDRIFFENGVTVTTNYTIGTTFGATANALSAGPITINAGVTVTVPSGSVYTVV